MMAPHYCTVYPAKANWGSLSVERKKNQLAKYQWIALFINGITDGFWHNRIVVGPHSNELKPTEIRSHHHLTAIILPGSFMNTFVFLS